jgi:RNA polymerase sigma factor (sigma-70 family)
MFGVCLRYAHSREDAEDILHDGFIAVFRDIHQFKNEGPIEGWVRRVILNTALQHLRKHSRSIFQSLEDNQWSAENEVTEEEHFEKEKLIKIMLESMQNMPTGFRTVLNLYIMEGYTHDQIAQTLGISSGTSKSQLKRAKDHLRSVLSKTLKVNE